MLIRRIRNLLLFGLMVVVALLIWVWAASHAPGNVNSLLSSLLFLVIGVAGLIVIGALLASPALVPPIRRSMQRYGRIRIIGTVALALLVFLLAFAAFSWLGSWMGFISQSNVWNKYPSLVDTEWGAIVHEVWMRGLFRLSASCFSPSSRICELADALNPTIAPTRDACGMISVLVAFMTGAWAWQYTHRRLFDVHEQAPRSSNY